MAVFVDQISLLALTCFSENLGGVFDRIDGRLSGSPTSDWKVDRGALDVKQVYFPRPPRGGRTPLSVVLWSPRTLPNWTVFYANSEDGWSHFVAKLAQSGGPESVSVRSSLPVEQWGIQEVQCHAPGSYEPRRIVRWLEDEDGYDFLERGEPYQFEKGCERSKDHVPSRDYILEFLGNLGIDLRDDNFWASDREAIYLRQTWRQNPEGQAGKITRVKWSELKKKMSG